MRAVIAWVCVLAIAIILIILSYHWLDRPLALLFHSQSQRASSGWWAMLSRIPNPLIPLAVIVFVAAALRALIALPLRRYQVAAFLASISVLVTEVAKDQLKMLFGRAWPESWMGNNASFIRDGYYGFHFMQGGGVYNAFPSGHTASAWAVLGVLWFWYPRWRALWLIGGLGVAGGLVGLNYHFLSDVVAGALLGGSVGWMVTVLWGSAGFTRLPVAGGPSSAGD